ncbi:MAG: HEAT repeat domain-containing protein, partial [Planctomycetota bacterium]|nr:HEAT repeat domain-containing protein [Planctomycetota bacterium]
MDRWVKELDNSDMQKRRAAAVELGKLGPKAAKASGALMKGIKKDPWGISRQALRAYKQMGPTAAPGVIAELDFPSSFPLTGFERSPQTVFSENGEALFWAARGLELMGDKALEQVKAEIQNAKGNKRVNLAIIHFWVKKDKDVALKAFKDSLTDKDASARLSAAKALGKMGALAESSIPDLSKALADKDQGVRLCVIDALSRVGKKVSSKLTPAMLAATKDPSPQVREAAFKALNTLKLKSPEVFAAITSGVADKDDDVRLAAAAYVVDHKAPETAVANLIAMSRLDDEDQRAEALEAFASLGVKASAAVPRLIEMLEDPEKSLRVTAAEALGAMGDKALSAIPALEKAVSEKYEDLSLEAIYTLRKLGPKAASATMTLVAALKRDRLIRWSAAGTLGFFGPKAKAAAPALLRVLKDLDPGIRSAAAKSLWQIQAKDGATIKALREHFKTEKEPAPRFAVQEALTALLPLKER